MQSIYKYIIFSIVLVCCVSPLNAQTKDTKTDSIPKIWYNGIRAEIDVAPLISTFLGNNETFSYEGGVQADILHKYYPVVEIGFGGADRTTSTDVRFTTSGMFGRIGLDFNLMKPKAAAKPSNNVFLAGARIGFSNFNYSMTNVVITDDYWNENTILNYNNEPVTKVWFEVVAGMRVEVIKNIYMGWTVRNKHTLGQSLTGEMNPWYIPGFGKNLSGSNWGVNYSIGYKF